MTPPNSVGVTELARAHLWRYEAVWFYLLAVIVGSCSRLETSLNTPCSPPRLRQATASDIETLIDLRRLCGHGGFRDGDARAELQRLLKVFPQGQSIVECDGQVRGSVASVIVDLDDDGGLDEITRDPVAAHDPDGDTLYSVNTCLDPSAPEAPVKQTLCEARRELCRWLNLRRILAAARTVGYASLSRSLGPEAYLRRVAAGELEDRALSAELRQGFVIRGALRQSAEAKGDSELLARVEWENPDYEAPIARFPARSRSGVMLRPTVSLDTAAR